MSIRNLHYLGAVDVGRRIHAKEISPVEVTKALLARIAKLDKKLRPYARVTADLALQQAKTAEGQIRKGNIKGPLHGVPIAVKDLCYTKGIVTAAGTSIHGGFKPKHDATVVKRFRDAGAILLGKLQLTEGAFADHHPDIRPPVNPWSAAHWSGASSSGSGVATAAGLCYASLGSDTGGSIRFPSAANGVTGLKPTWGRVSRYGVFDLGPSFDHIGPMTRSAADAAAVLGVIAGADKNDPTALQDPVPNYLAGLDRGIRGLRIGVDADYNTRGVDAVMKKTVNDALKVLAHLGADIRPVKFPSPDRIVKEWAVQCSVEAAVVHADNYPKKKAAYGRGLADFIDLGRSVSALDFQRVVMNRKEFSGRVAAMFEHCDVLAIPAQHKASFTVRQMASLAEDAETLNMLLRFTAPFDYTGSPAITLPSGFTRAGTPIAFQLVGRHLEEDVLLRAGHAYQQATDWHITHPKV